MKKWCDIDEEYVYLKEPAAAIGEIWECDGDFFLILDRGTKYEDNDWRYRIYQIYPVVIRSEECKFREDRVFTFVCTSKELEKFFEQHYIEQTIPFHNYGRKCYKDDSIG